MGVRLALPSIKLVDWNVIARFEGIKAGEITRLLFVSDIHFDSVYCEREVLKRHLDTNPDAWIVIAGDLFDAMQGRYDNRRSYDEIREEYKGGNYYDLILDDTVKFFLPYAHRLLYLGYGNHETAVLKYANTDLLQRFAERISKKSDSVVAVGGYASWLRIVFGRENGGRKTWSKGINIRIAHNAGGGGTQAPVTRGLIQTNRQAVYLQNADIVVNGDNHEGYAVPIARQILLDSGKCVQTVTWFLRTPGYKQAFGKQRVGFDIEKIATPKPMGCVLVALRPHAERNHSSGGVRDIEIVPTPIIE